MSRALATDVEHRLLAWPAYQDDQDLRTLAERFVPALLDRPDVCLCLRHDPALDPPLDQSMSRVERVLGGAVGRHALEVLIVDELAGDGWNTLGGELSAVLTTPSREHGPRRQALASLGVPVLSNEDDLGACIGRQPRQLTWSATRERDKLELGFDRPTILLIEGEPGQGKTSLFQAIRDAPRWGSNDPGAAHGETDHWYVQFVRQALPATLPDQDPDWLNSHIRPHYAEFLSDDQRAQVHAHLVARLVGLVEGGHRRIVVEGWLICEILAAITDSLAGKANLVPVQMMGHTLVLRDGHAVFAGVERLEGESEAAFTRRTARANARAFAILRTFLRMEFARRLIPDTAYQTFAEYGGQDDGDSASRAKLESLRLPDLTGKRALDAGCNTGYFSLKLRELGAAEVLGLDGFPGFIATAQRYRDHVFELDRVSFAVMDVCDLEGTADFDVVLVLSVFHYFRARQQEFLDRVFDLLRPGGLLILEVGISRERPGEDHVQHYARSIDAGDPCHFPNRTAFARLTARYELVYEGPSVFQMGDLIPRFVLHLRKP